ncbi:MAG: acyl-CoA thioesterase [Candidatus Margulisbacteria bacterium]|nr:acyl-CoA thioesterase [Candidatus Margulisiibacteriota bacterium]
MKQEFQYRVIYKDTDAEGVVYYANYLGLFERGRTELLEQLGIDLKQIKEQKRIVFAIAKVECDYKSPAKLYDEITVTTKIESQSAVRIVFIQEVLRGKEILVLARITACAIGLHDFKPTRLPADIRFDQ